MKALHFGQYGSPDFLEIREIEKPNNWGQRKIK